MKNAFQNFSFGWQNARYWNLKFFFQKSWIVAYKGRFHHGFSGCICTRWNLAVGAMHPSSEQSLVLWSFKKGKIDYKSDKNSAFLADFFKNAPVLLQPWNRPCYIQAFLWQSCPRYYNLPTRRLLTDFSSKTTLSSTVRHIVHIIFLRFKHLYCSINFSESDWWYQTCFNLNIVFWGQHSANLAFLASSLEKMN